MAPKQIKFVLAKELLNFSETVPWPFKFVEKELIERKEFYIGHDGLVHLSI